jgi:hypothetical protein
VLIKALSGNIDIEYRDICCQNIEYRVEIEKAYRPITNSNIFLKEWAKDGIDDSAVA